ncbi:hypothetical protein V2J09_011962 [Rumex salicifolius]
MDRRTWTSLNRVSPTRFIATGTLNFPLEFVSHLNSAAEKISSSLLPSRSPSPKTPFVPREKLVEKQKLFQTMHKHIHLKGRYDKITSVAIPLALTVSSLFLIGKGIYNMSHGIGKKE